MTGRQIALRRTMLMALFAAVLAVLSPWAIPIGSISITFSLLGVFLIGGILGWARGLIVVLLYLALGAVGVPIFAGFSGGVGHFLSPTGGFLIGYVPCVLLAGISNMCRKTWLRVAVIATSLLLLYLVGGAWFAFVSQVSFAATLVAVVLPCLPFDILKLTAAGILIPLVEKPLKRLGI